jgi:hypothetical protein
VMGASMMGERGSIVPLASRASFGIM